jgi:hypothetical protein
MTSTGGPFARFKQPEYIGENRCVPCTVVNTIIAAVGSVIAGIALAQFVTVAVGAGVSLTIFSLSLLAVYLRGYLVPGTPTLTKRYLPVWVLDLFGKAPDTAGEQVADTDIDPEEELLDAAALEPCEDHDDLCLTDEFREAWYDEIDRVNTERDASRERFLALLGLDDAEVTFTEHGAAFQAFADGTVVGRWESEAAYLADLGAARALERRYDRWARLSVEARGQLLNGLRLFIDTCPACGGTPTFGTDTVESCCTTQEVAAVACEECDARLFESPM